MKKTMRTTTKKDMTQRFSLVSIVGWVMALLLLVSCGNREDSAHNGILETAPWDQPWDSIEAEARGSTVHMMMWMGDPQINQFMTDYIGQTLMKEYGIRLEISSGQGNQIVNHLIAEREAGKRESALDIVWINGETFYQLRQIGALDGPFTDRLPNSEMIDWDNPYISRDFQQDIEGMECPWGNVQLAFIYDTLRVAEPPAGFAELENWIRTHPGRFTIPVEFTGMTVLKSWMMSLAEDPSIFYGAFNDSVYLKYSSALWEKINDLKPYLWKNGRTFPESVAATHQMFASGELDFTFSNNEAEVDNKVLQGFLPPGSAAYFPEPGTIQNSHYLGLVKGAPNPAGALFVINHLISPDAQFQKKNPGFWGDGSVLDTSRLPEIWKPRFRDIPNRFHAPERIPGRSFQEPAPEYMIRIFRDFRKFVTDAD